jgi:very-short-patch-repair endonuclease
MTDAEQRLWQALRNRQLGGWKFRRQYPVGPFIADFACVEKKLVVEVDGGQHAKGLEKDHKRSEYLELRGYRVLRFWDNQVLQETDSVLEAIMFAVLEDTPSPQPSPP